MDCYRHSARNFSYPPAFHKCRYEKLYHNGTIHVKWDNGRTLGIIPGQDSFSVVEQTQEPIAMDDLGY